MRRLANNIISVCYSFVRIGIRKMAYGSNFTSGLVQRISPNVVLEFNRNARVSLGDKVRIHSGGKIKVRSGAELVIGSGAKFNYNCGVFCHRRIVIGPGVEFGPNVLVYDHDHDFRSGGGAQRWCFLLR
ncbi:hypothetical protein [Adlercreutzia sp. ZJ242]|uniref:acyltransferase n=1 Tax=Adlercreutzia sp. ZJ242 TaxID=2709409 RepID=UPI0013EA607E|nr:hypothetical protein [Adlercreutzia sp. ZJ242]